MVSFIKRLTAFGAWMYGFYLVFGFLFDALRSQPDDDVLFGIFLAYTMYWLVFGLTRFATLFTGGKIEGPFGLMSVGTELPTKQDAHADSSRPPSSIEALGRNSFSPGTTPSPGQKSPRNDRTTSMNATGRPQPDPTNRSTMAPGNEAAAYKSMLDDDLRHTTTLDSPQNATNTPSNHSTFIPKTQKSTGPRFVASYEKVNMGDFTLHGPIYIGRPPFDQRGYIDPSKPVRWKPNQSPEGLSYWPHYSYLSSDQRGQYLAWLAGQRGYINETGYAFLYFYGFEQYLAWQADKTRPAAREQHLKDIIVECERLAGLLKSQSFTNYSSDFIDIIIIKYLPDMLDQRLKEMPLNSCFAARYAIAKAISEGDSDPLPAPLAFQWFFVTGKLRERMFKDVDFDSFRSFFIQFYESKGGVKIKKNVKKLDITYRFAAAKVGPKNSREVTIHTDYCSPFDLKGPNDKLNALLTSAKLKHRKLVTGRNKGPLEYLQVLPPNMALPPELRTTQQRLLALIESDSDNEGRVVRTTAQKLGEVFDVDYSQGMSLAQRRAVANACERLGVSMIPDPNLHKLPVAPQDCLMLRMAPRLNALSTKAMSVDLGLRMAAMVASEDGISKAEWRIIKQLSSSIPDPDERDYIMVYAQWLATSSSTSKAGLKEQIKSMTRSERIEIFGLLVDITLADGKVTKGELRQLRSVHKTLDLGEFDMLAHKKLQNAPRASSGTKAEPAGRDSEGGSEQGETTGPALDMTKLAAMEASTQNAQSLLAQIFDDEDTEEGVDSEIRVEGSTVTPLDQADPDRSGETPTWHQGELNAKQEAVFNELIEREEWSRTEVESICQKHALMVDGTLEAINEVALKRYGENILEQAGDEILVYADLL